MKSDKTSRTPISETVEFDSSPNTPTTVSPHITMTAEQQDALLGAPEGTLRNKIKLLSPKERACLAAILNGANFAEAARIANCSYPTAYGLRKKIPDLMERRGLTDEILCAKLEQLLDAKETKFFSAKVEGRTLYIEDDGTQRLVDTTEIIIEDREVEALDVQLRALDLATKFKGWHRTIDAEDVSRDSHDINVNIIHVGGDAKL